MINTDELYEEYFYESASDEFNKLTQKVAKILKMDIKDLPKYITMSKRKYKMKKLKKEFDIKLIKENGKLVRTLTIDGKTVKMYRINKLASNEDEKELYKNIGPFSTTVAALGGLIEGSPGDPIILVDDSFFNSDLDLQRFILYHEFAHVRLHIPSSDILGNDIPKELKQKILEDLFIQANNGRITRDQIHRDGIIKDVFDEYMKCNGYKKFCNDDNVTSSKYRTQVRKYFEDKIKNDKKLQKQIKKYSMVINKNTAKSINNEIYSHYTPMELEADDFARRKMGNKSIKAINKLDKFAKEIKKKNVQVDNTRTNEQIKIYKDIISNAKKENKELMKEINNNKNKTQLSETKNKIKENNETIRGLNKTISQSRFNKFATNTINVSMSTLEPKARKRVLKERHMMSKITPAAVKESTYEKLYEVIYTL